MTELTAEQRAVEAQIDDFIRDPHPKRMYFVFQGLAGVGKSVLLAHIARKYPRALLCAFTGKAASVVARKSGLPAMTIHSALYACYGKDKDTDELKFGRKINDGAWHGNLVLVDEASTVNEWLARDLLATGCKIVACGDDGQLAPIKGSSYFTSHEPDARLLEVHRQAWDSPIIRQAHSVRAGTGYVDDGPDFRIEKMVSRDDIMATGMVLCYRNPTRADLNRIIRTHHGYNDVARRGEPVMALRNEPEWGILNGAVYTLMADHYNSDGNISIVNEHGREVEIENAWIEGMEAGPVSLIAKNNPFAWGYCATVHKSQGSEWERVILVDEYNRSDDRDKWLYTGITRASKSIIVQRHW